MQVRFSDHVRGLNKKIVGDVYSVTLSPDGKYLVSGDQDSVRIFDFETRVLIHRYQGKNISNKRFP